MKRTVNLSAVLLLFVLFAGQVFGQADKTKGFVFTEKVRLPATCVKDQYRSGTCWSFSSLSFIEAEMLRLKKETTDLSEMFVVNTCYKDKAEKYVRMHGNLNFGGGGAFHDAFYTMKNYGIVPEEAYKGLNYGTEGHVHGELDEVLSSFVKAVVKNENKTLSTAWKKAYDAVVDSYLGAIPQKFNYKGKEYTPKTFAKEYVGLNPDDYVELTSFSHHPFYSKFIIEIPDNWLWDEVYNVPLKEMGEIIDNSLNNGYSVAWGADVSHKGFAYSKGVAVIPDLKVDNKAGLEQAKWESMSIKEKEDELYKLDGPVKEKVITQEMRQIAFDNYSTTDDHGMLIVGIAFDQNGTKYYIVKNSWNENSLYKGYFYASEAFVLLQTTDIMINKNAIPGPIKQKLGL